jgi:hypothetical protein
MLYGGPSFVMAKIIVRDLCICHFVHIDIIQIQFLKNHPKNNKYFMFLSIAYRYLNHANVPVKALVSTKHHF